MKIFIVLFLILNLQLNAEPSRGKLDSRHLCYVVKEFDGYSWSKAKGLNDVRVRSLVFWNNDELHIDNLKLDFVEFNSRDQALYSDGNVIATTENVTDNRVIWIFRTKIRLSFKEQELEYLECY